MQKLHGLRATIASLYASEIIKVMIAIELRHEIILLARVFINSLHVSIVLFF